jgi:hypothetical protein
MKSGFLTELSVELKAGCDGIWAIRKPLSYYSELLKQVVTVPHGFPVGEETTETANGEVCFYTDFASVPRVPIIWESWGDRCHRESVLHDYLYRYDSIPLVSRSIANSVFLEAMKARGVALWIRLPMYWGVCLGGWGSYHKRSVRTELF